MPPEKKKFPFKKWSIGTTSIHWSESIFKKILSLELGEKASSKQVFWATKRESRSAMEACIYGISPNSYKVGPNINLWYKMAFQSDTNRSILELFPS